MKNVSRIFSAMVCSASLFAYGAYGAVATTAGSNLTAFNPSNSYNNQWASMTNGRYDSTASAKADFGNCNAIVLRCAQPKCANGGCGEMSVAAGIVAGCVKSNDKCKQYGDDLINYMTAQLVASSQAKINAANAEQLQAAQQAAEQAQAAAQQAQMAQQQQIAEMQSNMQQQMMQMQQQMAEQNAQSAQAIADALAASQQQQQQAISEMRSAATTAAQAEVTGAVVTQEDKEAISRGVSEDVLLRETISGQINTYIDNANTSLNEVKAAMETSFEYAGCDNRGDNCAGPKRVKKWRELAVEFIDPYDKVVDNISNALDVAQVVGADLNDIYMMLNNSCNQWGQYMCTGNGRITYDIDPKTGQKGAPSVCTNSLGVDNSAYNNCLLKCRSQNVAANIKSTQLNGGLNAPDFSGDFMQTNSLFSGSDIKIEFDPNMLATANAEVDCAAQCAQYRSLKVNADCTPCTLLKLLPDKEEVYDMWVNTESNSPNNQVIVACASSAMKTGLLARHAKRKSGAGTLDLDVLEEWINAHESNTVKNNEADKIADYCAKFPNIEAVKNKKVIDPKQLCTNKYQDDYCDGIKPEYAICDTHPWNAGLYGDDALASGNLETTKTAVGNKVTLVSQQLYKQYEYLRATLKRLETSLKKSVLAAKLEKAGASSNNSGGGSGGSSRNSDNTIFLAGAENCFNKSNKESVYSCLQTNANLIITAASTNAVKACKQLRETLKAAKLALAPETYNTVSTSDDCKKVENACNKNVAVSCAQQLNFGVMNELDKQKQQTQGLQLLLGGTR